MKDEYTYLISNVHRSGSSMMMRCLEAGGMDVAYDDSQEILNTIHGRDGYMPNTNGFYALSEDFSRKDFYQIYQGKTLKCPFRNLATLPEGKYKLVFIKRNPKEIRASMEAFTPGVHWGSDMDMLDQYDVIIDGLLNLLESRKDMDILVLNYSDIVSNPIVEFTKMKEAGWNIDVDKCASMVDESLHRFKLESK